MVVKVVESVEADVATPCAERESDVRLCLPSGLEEGFMAVAGGASGNRNMRLAVNCIHSPHFMHLDILGILDDTEGIYP